MRLSLFVDLGLEVLTREGRALENSRQEIHRATQRLLPDRPHEQVVALLFLAHPSITAAFPAEGARLVGWSKTPLLCLQAPDLPELTIKVVALCAPPGSSWVGVRGANTVKQDTKHALVELLSALQQKNPHLPTQSIYILTTVTSDLEEKTATTALQNIKWNQCLADSGIELNVSSIPKVVRVLIIFQGSEAASHVFLHETAQAAARSVTRASLQLIQSLIFEACSPPDRKNLPYCAEIKYSQLWITLWESWGQGCEKTVDIPGQSGYHDLSTAGQQRRQLVINSA